MTQTLQTASAVSAPALNASELLHWNDLTARRWQKLLVEHPEALDLKCDIYGTENLRGVIRHLVAVELRYAQRLSGEPVTAYEEIPDGSTELLFSLHDSAIEKFGRLLTDDTIDWNEKLEFKTVSMGTLQATRRNILFHALLHGIRHYAQLATLVRQHGIKPDWPMDYLFAAMAE
jgi:uncharacterized damage-inducible protein DinB